MATNEMLYYPYIISPKVYQTRKQIEEANQQKAQNFHEYISGKLKSEVSDFGYVNEKTADAMYMDSQRPNLLFNHTDMGADGRWVPLRPPAQPEPTNTPFRSLATQDIYDYALDAMIATRNDMNKSNPYVLQMVQDRLNNINTIQKLISTSNKPSISDLVAKQFVTGIPKEDLAVESMTTESGADAEKPKPVVTSEDVASSSTDVPKDEKKSPEIDLKVKFFTRPLQKTDLIEFNPKNPLFIITALSDVFRIVVVNTLYNKDDAVVTFRLENDTEEYNMNLDVDEDTLVILKPTSSNFENEVVEVEIKNFKISEKSRDVLLSGFPIKGGDEYSKRDFEIDETEEEKISFTVKNITESLSIGDYVYRMRKNGNDDEIFLITGYSAESDKYALNTTKGANRISFSSLQKNYKLVTTMVGEMIIGNIRLIRKLSEEQRDAFLSKYDRSLARGKGVVDFVKSLFSKNIPLHLRSFLKRFGSFPITGIMLQKEPVNKTISTLLNVLSLGKLQENLDRKNYDDLFHLSMILTIKTGPDSFITARLEKNERLLISQKNASKSKSSEMKTLSVPMDGKTLTLQDMMRNAIEKFGMHRIVTYDAKKFNCQNFIHDLLSANSLMNPELDAFIIQDTGSIFSELGYIARIARNITNLGAIADSAVRGGAVKFETYPVVSVSKHPRDTRVPRKKGKGKERNSR
jgi:hypothetical protein